MKFSLSLVSVLSALVLTAIPIWTKPGGPNIPALADQCRRGKNSACRELAQLAVKGKDDGVRRDAVAALTDQSLLAKIADDDKNPDIRMAAVKTLTDRAALAKVATNDKDPGVRIVVVWGLIDQSLLAKIATDDKSPDVRKAAVERLTDRSPLAKIAVNDQDPGVRVFVVRRLIDQSLLAKIATDDKNPDVRKAAVETLTDQSPLAKIAVDDQDPSVRVLVVRRLIDQSLLAKIAGDDKNPDVHKAAVEKLADLGKIVAATGLIATFTLMPPSIPAYRLSDGKEMSFPWDIWGFWINGVSVACENYTKDTALGLKSFTKFRRDGDFFFITTKSFGEIQMKIMEEKPPVSDHFRPGPADYKCEIWATRSKATEILDQLTKKNPK